jgi:hypothetical protein
MNYQRPPGFKFACKGVDLRSPADAMQPDKYVILQNIRAASDNSLQTRPGYVLLFDTGDAHAVTDIGSYATLGTDGKPRFLAHLSNDKVYLDTGDLVATLATSNQAGVCMIPFRPSASPQAWMYITNGADYQKLSAPDSSGNVVASKVGIAEPQAALDASTEAPAFTTFYQAAADWTAAGTAGALSDGAVLNDTVGAAVIADPVVDTRLSCQVTIPYYSPGMLATFASAHTYPIEEVWNPCDTCTITAIQYYSGTAGKCMVVPSVDLSDTIGRGSLVTLGTETVLVLSVIKGENGTCAFECSTAGTHAATEAITGVLAIVVYGAVSPGDSVAVPDVLSSVTSGTGTLSQTLSASNLFRKYTQDDYIHVVLLLNNIAAVTTINLIFDIGKSTPDYTTSILTYSITGASLAPLLLAGEIVEIHFPISALNGSLEYCYGFRVEIVTGGTCITGVGSLWVGGGSGPDIGDTGIPYRYRAVPRSSTTGAQGNPCPDERSSASPRRQSVLVKTSALAFTDPQVDLLDVYRYGGSLTSFRYLGTVSVGSDFTDTYFDDALTDAAVLNTDNFEPWPSIDVPFKVSAGVGTTITAVGTWVTVTGPTVWPSNILRWLPGTLLTLANVDTVTLRSRPVSLSATSYLFEIEECVGSATATEFSVLEPDVACQILPYLVGPDEYGTLFGMGDPLRPGTLYESASFNFDSVPSENTNELSPPSEPLIGGAQLGAVTMVSSTDRWWAIYPSFLLGSTGNYTTLRRDVGRALAAPHGICSDGQKVYFWAKDCIAATAGGAYEDLTSKTDLYPLFAHEGIPGSDVSREGDTFHAPDYSRVASFRLSVANKFLYADYQDADGANRTLVLDLQTGSWSRDEYHDRMTVHYSVPQQSGALAWPPAANPLAVMGDSQGRIWQQQDLHNDNATPIVCLVSTFEWDGGDDRAQPEWGDTYLDCLPAAGAGIQVTPMSQMAPIPSGTVNVPQGPRAGVPISVGKQFTGKSLGLLLSWSDDFRSQVAPTKLFRWGVSALPQPEITGDRAGDWG